ncbi:MAG: fructokinase [Saprospiraceae bacterium]|jgi:fructokinase
MGPVWGIDLGGTKIEGVILEDREQPNVLKRLRIPTEAQHGYEHIIQQIVRLVEVMTSETGMKPGKIGIGTPGTTEPSSGLMKNCNTTCLNGMPLKKDIQKALGIPVNLANDANCFTIAEATFGVVRQKVPDARVVFGVIMGTGIGGGLVVDGKIIGGKHGIGGEWGHNFLDDSGGDCYCGKTGCVETILSGPNLEKYYENIMGVPRKLKEIVERHKEGDDEVATKTVHRLLGYFGKAFSNIINIVDPDAVVIGGGVGNIDLLFTDGVWEVEKNIFNHTLETPFLKPKLGDSAGVFGAALL